MSGSFLPKLSSTHTSHERRNRSQTLPRWDPKTTAVTASWCCVMQQRHCRRKHTHTRTHNNNNNKTETGAASQPASQPGFFPFPRSSLLLIVATGAVSSLTAEPSSAPQTPATLARDSVRPPRCRGCGSPAARRGTGATAEAPGSFTERRGR